MNTIAPSKPTPKYIVSLETYEKMQNDPAIAQDIYNRMTPKTSKTGTNTQLSEISKNLNKWYFFCLLIPHVASIMNF